MAASKTMLDVLVNEEGDNIVCEALFQRKDSP